MFSIELIDTSVNNCCFYCGVPSLLLKWADGYAVFQTQRDWTNKHGNTSCYSNNSKNAAVLHTSFITGSPKIAKKTLPLFFLPFEACRKLAWPGNWLFWYNNEAKIHKHTKKLGLRTNRCYKTCTQESNPRSKPTGPRTAHTWVHFSVLLYT